MNLLAEGDLGSVRSHQEQPSKKKMRICKQRIYPRRQGRHHIAEHGRDERRVFDLQTKIALTLAKNDDRSLHKCASTEHTQRDTSSDASLFSSALCIVSNGMIVWSETLRKLRTIILTEVPNSTCSQLFELRRDMPLSRAI